MPERWRSENSLVGGSKQANPILKPSRPAGCETSARPRREGPLPDRRSMGTENRHHLTASNIRHSWARYCEYFIYNYIDNISIEVYKDFSKVN